jgi:non-ribosomal peptide synthetase component F
VVDLEACPEPARAAETARLVAEWAGRPFDLERGPLFRKALLRLSDGEHLLLLNVHHIASDGWSNGILVREMSTLYQAFAAGRPSPLAPLPIQYADYAVWQRSWLTGDVLDGQLAFWRSRLGDDPEPLELPADRPRPAVQSGRGALEQLSLPPGSGSRLEQLGRARGATSFIVFLAAFKGLLHRYTGREDLSVGTPVANRNRLDIEELIGCFVNTLVLHTDLAGDPTFPELLDRVRETALSAYTHQELPFERLVEELVSSRDLSRTPLCQVVFALQQEADGTLELGPELRAEPYQRSGTTAKFDLAVFLGRFADGTELLAEYSTDLFEGATIQRLLGHLGVLIAGIERHPEARLSELPLLSADEREQVLTGWNQTAADIPGLPVHALFEAWARERPGSLAIEGDGQRLTYGELDRRASLLAAELRRHGVGPEGLVALLLEPSPELATAAIAALKTGGAYLPIDPAHPTERVRHMLADSGARVLVTTGAGLQRLPELAVPVISLDDAVLEDGPPLEAVAEAGPDGLAYVIYTSGSTGLPKGTELRHGSLSNLCAWHLRAYGLGPDDRTTLLAGPSFDASVWELWPALTAGASLHVPPPDVARNPPVLLAWLAERRITVTFLPTPLAEAVLAEMVLAKTGPDGLCLRTLLTGGDRLSRRPVARLPFELVNHYGPTESTVVATAGAVDPRGMRAPEIGSAIACSLCPSGSPASCASPARAWPAVTVDGRS